MSTAAPDDSESGTKRETDPPGRSDNAVEERIKQTWPNADFAF